MTENLPAYLNDLTCGFDFAAAEEGVGAARAPHVSIGGNKFTLVEEDGSEQLVSTTDPKYGYCLDAIIMAVAPGNTRIYYATDWEEGRDNYDPPDCTSVDGVRPDASAPSPQSDSCVTCERAKWGAKVRNGKDVPACQSGKRVALYIEDKGFYTLRITPGSFKAWTSYLGVCKKNGKAPPGLVTRIIFTSQGKLAFGAVKIVTPELAAKANKPEEVRALLDLAPKTPEPAPVTQPAIQVTPLIFPELPAVQPDNFGGTRPITQRTRRTKAQMEAARSPANSLLNQPMAQEPSVQPPPKSPAFGMMAPEGGVDKDFAQAITDAFAVDTD